VFNVALGSQEFHLLFNCHKDNILSLNVEMIIGLISNS